MDKHHVLTSIELEQFLDQQEERLQQSNADPAEVLAALQGHSLLADSLESVQRLSVLWVNAGDTDGAWNVLVGDGAALLASLPEEKRDEARMNLCMYRLRLSRHLHNEAAINQALDELLEMAKQPLDFDVEHYRRAKLFTDLERSALSVALKAIDLSWTLASNYPQRSEFRAWDDADRYRKQAIILAHHSHSAQAQEAALRAVAALAQAGPDQDINESDWAWFGDALIEIIPSKISVFKEAITTLTSQYSMPCKREWAVVATRLEARSLHAQGRLDAALQLCSAAAVTLEPDGGNNFISYQLPWLIQAGHFDAAGKRALEELVMRCEYQWLGIAPIVAQRLQDAQDQSVWWPLCVMLVATDKDLCFEAFIKALPAIDSLGVPLHPLLESLYQVEEIPSTLDEVYAAAHTESLRRDPENPWILRLHAVHEGRAGRITPAERLALLRKAVMDDGLQDFYSVCRLLEASVEALGVLDALLPPFPQLQSGWDAYQYALSIEEIVNPSIENLPSTQRETAISLTDMAERDAYEQGLALMERFFETGHGHRDDACVHLYSMLCNNLANNYRCVDPVKNNDAMALHERGIASSPFAEHYHGILQNKIVLMDHRGTVEAAESLWHFAAENGYSRHDPDDYVCDVAHALKAEGRESDILIWIERLLDWQKQQEQEDSDLEEYALLVRMRLAATIAHIHPEHALAIWARYEQYVLPINSIASLNSAGVIFHGIGNKERALEFYTLALSKLDPKDETYESNKQLIEENIAMIHSLYAEERSTKRKWWQWWK